MDKKDYSVKAHEMYKKIKLINQKVRRSLEAHYCYTKTYNDRNMSGTFFEEGQEVFVLLQCRAHKFCNLRWVGPYPIKRKVNDHLYVVSMPDEQEKVFGVAKLKLYKRNKFSPPTDASLGAGSEGARGESQVQGQIPVSESITQNTIPEAVSGKYVIPSRRKPGAIVPQGTIQQETGTNDSLEVEIHTELPLSTDEHQASPARLRCRRNLKNVERLQVGGSGPSYTKL